MSDFLALGSACAPRQLESKSAALLYALSVATKYNDKGGNEINYKKAQKVFEFINANVELPDLKQDPNIDIAKGYGRIAEVLEKVIEKETKKQE